MEVKDGKYEAPTGLYFLLIRYRENPCDVVLHWSKDSAKLAEHLYEVRDTVWVGQLVFATHDEMKLAREMWRRNERENVLCGENDKGKCVYFYVPYAFTRPVTAFPTPAAFPDRRSEPPTP